MDDATIYLSRYIASIVDRPSRMEILQKFKPVEATEGGKNVNGVAATDLETMPLLV